MKSWKNTRKVKEEGNEALNSGRILLYLCVPKFDPGVLGFQEVLVLNKTRDETLKIFWHSPGEYFGGKVPNHAALT